MRLNEIWYSSREKLWGSMTSPVLCPFSRPLFSSLNGYCRRWFWIAEVLATGSSCARSLKGWFGKTILLACLYASACLFIVSPYQQNRWQWSRNIWSFQWAWSLSLILMNVRYIEDAKVEIKKSCSQLLGIFLPTFYHFLHEGSSPR